MKKLFAIFILSIYSLLVFGQWYDFIGNLQFDTAVSVPAQSRGLMFYEGTDSDSLSFYDGVGLKKIKQYEGDRSLNYQGYADLYDASALTYGNNAVFGDGAGGTAPTKSTVTSEYIDGLGVFKVTGAAQNDWVGLDVVPVEEVQDKAVKHVFEMKYRSTVDTDWQERVRCGAEHHVDSTNAVGLQADKYRVVADFVVAQSTASCKVGLQCVNVAGCSDILFTKMRVDDDAKIVKNFQRENEYSARINDNATYENESTTWIASVTNPSLGRYDIVPVSGFFSVRPNAVANRNDGSAGKSNYSYAESTKDLIVVRTTSAAGTAENGGFSIVLQRGLGDYKEAKDGTVYAGGDVAKLENHFSARISNNGSTATVKSQGATFISSVNRTGTGTVEINFPVGFFTVVPSVTASVLDNDRANATVLSSSQTMIVIKTHSDDGSTNFVDIEFDINVSRQGSDYKNTLDIDNIIVDGDSITTNHVLGGVEYKVNEKLWDGKQVYARSFETAVSMTPSSDHVLATTVTGLDIIEIKGSGYASPSWYNLNGTASSGEGYIRYQDSTGNITARNDATTFTQQRFTIEYIKP